jgi:hypothetical protein
MGWRKHFSSVNNSGLPYNLQGDGQGQTGGPLGAASSNRYATWLPEVYAGPPNRLMRYMQYEAMDQDLEINSALDTIAEFGTQENEVTGTAFEINYTEDPSDTESAILTKTLTQWCSLNEMHKRAFRLFRNTVKMGDQFFLRDPETYELFWIDPANIEKVLVNESEGKKIQTYFIKNLEPNFEAKIATTPTSLGNRNYGAGNGFTGSMVPANGGGGGSSSFLGGQGTDNGVPVDAKHIVHISLTEGMDQSWPFGNSILECIYKVFKQKELLEDSIIIYRVHRAPERRVFFIDVGNMPAHKAKQYIEQVKYEVQQKHIPNKGADGSSIIDGSYNPMSMLEDYFFAQTADGRGSKVDTLEGGDNLGQIDDLKYFNNRMVRGLRIPSSYLPTGPEDGTAAYNDGKVGIAYIQEYRFSKYVERLQNQVQESLDHEFKMYLKYKGIDIDNSAFNIQFSEPLNFNSYRDLQLDAERAGVYAQFAGIATLSEQFKMKKYLGLTEDEMKENEKLWREENDEDKYNDPDEDGSLRSMGVRPDGDEAAMGELEPEELDGLDDEAAPGEMGGEINSNAPPGNAGGAGPA